MGAVLRDVRRQSIGITSHRRLQKRVETASNALVIGVIFTLAFSVVSICLTNPFLKLLNTKDTLIGGADVYLKIQRNAENICASTVASAVPTICILNTTTNNNTGTCQYLSRKRRRRCKLGKPSRRAFADAYEMPL